MWVQNPQDMKDLLLKKYSFIDIWIIFQYNPNLLVILIYPVINNIIRK